MSRRRFDSDEVQELRRGLLLRMQELLEDEMDLHAAEVTYSLFSRLKFGGKGRPKKVKVNWDFIRYVVDSFSARA